jgi:hypothetical protein
VSAYLVLQQVESGIDAMWREAGVVQAGSAEVAVRRYVEKEAKGGVFIAIPERSAKTIRVKVETVQKVSVDAGEEA